MGTHPIFESDFDCLTDNMSEIENVVKLLKTCNIPEDIEAICEPLNILACDEPGKANIDLRAAGMRDWWTELLWAGIDSICGKTHEL